VTTKHHPKHPTPVRHPVRRRAAPTAAPRPPAPAPVGHLAGGHRVYIFALSRPAKLTALLAEPGGRVTGGFGKWEEIAVPRGQAFTQWIGRTLLAMDLELMLDGWHDHRSVEADIQTVEEMATPPGPRPPGGAPVTPPPIRFVGAVPHTERTWVIGGLDWGDSIRDLTTGHRLRQAVTLHLLEYVEETVIGALPPPKAAPRKVKVKRGDDLKKLAAHYLGKSSRWPEIVKLNKGLRGWKLSRKLVGKTILIPGH
jgi:hypothetical protein